MSKTAVKKALAGMTREQLTEVLLDLYSARPQAREWLDFFVEPKPREAMDKALDAALKECRRSKWSNSKMRISVINNITKEFATLGVDPVDAVDLRVCMCDLLCRVDNTFYLSDAQLRSVYTYFVKTVDAASKAGILPETLERLDKLKDGLLPNSQLLDMLESEKLLDDNQNG